MNRLYRYKNLAMKSMAVITAITMASAGLAGCGDADTAEDTAVEASAESFEDEDTQKLTDLISTQVGGSEDDVDKQESVYVIADANGTATNVIVSDWLRNTDASDELKDASDLQDIANVKGDETYTADGDQLTWAANGNDIYYQGTTDKTLPVDVKVTYYLDGEEMSAEDIAGKSGNVTIRFDYTNNEKAAATIDGKLDEVYVPFTVMSAMILPTDTFGDITVTNGRVISEGNNNIVMGLAFPGLADSLQLDETELADKDIEIPDYVEVNAVTTDFKLDMTVSAILSDALSDIHLTDSIDLSELDDSMDDLTDATNQLEDGTGELADGVQTLYDSTGDFSSGAKSLYDGVVAYTDGVSQVASGVDTLKDGTSQLASGASTLSSGASELNSKVQAINVSISDDQKAQINATVAADPTRELADGATTLTNTLAGALTSTQIDALIKQAMNTATGSDVAYNTMVAANPNYSDIIGYAASASQGVVTSSTAQAGVKAGLTSAAQGGALKGAQAVASTVGSSMDTLKSATAQLASGAAQVSDGANQVNSGVDSLKSGVSTLNSNSSALVDGAKKLYDGTGELTDGVSQLLDGANELNDGMIQFDQDGISKLTDAFESDGKNVLDRLNATMDAAKGYHTFTSLADGQEGSVKFIVRTAAVE